MRIFKFKMNVYPFQQICNTVRLSLTFLSGSFLYYLALYHPNYHILTFTYLSKKTKKTKQLSSSICRYYIKHWRMDSPIPSNKLWAGECGWLWVVQVVGDNKSKYHTNSSPGGSFPKMKCIIQWRNISCESQFGTIKAGTSSSSKMNIKTENLRLWRFKKMYTITR